MRSLSVKLTLAFLIVGLSGAVLAALFIQQRTRNEFNRFLSDQYSRSLVNTLTEYYQATGTWDGVEQVMSQAFTPRRLHTTDTPPPSTPAVLPDGPSGPQPFRAPLTLVNLDRVIVFGDPGAIGTLATQQMINQGIPLEVDGRVVGWLTTSTRAAAGARLLAESPEQRFLASINQIILLSALTSLVIALLLGALLARALTRPLRELTDATQALAKGQLGAQVKVHSNDEMGRLSASFNQMSTDLARAIQARRQMTADIAHDLRSPLSVILGYTEALSDGKLGGTLEIFEVMHKEAGHLNRLIDDLRTLSLVDAGELQLYLQEVAPVTLLERAAAAYAPLAAQKSIHLEMVTEADLPTVSVDPERMAQVLGNLLNNALRYTLAGGQIRLIASASSAGVELHVQDSGPGIALEDQAYIFERFYRGDKSRTSDGESGLGLAIAKSLVEAQGAKISLVSAPGSGADFVILFPTP